MNKHMLRLAGITDAPSPATLNLASRSVGPGEPALVIAEIGVNHDGRLDRALRLVEAAWEAGADAVKLQLFKAHRLVHATARLATYQQATGAASPTELLRRCELDDHAVEQVVHAIRQAGMLPIATPFSPEDVQRVADLGLPAVKLASPDLVNTLLLDACASLNVPMLVSTGASKQDEINAAVARLSNASADFALLHCVSSYPTADGDADLARISELASRYGRLVGYSDHTQNLSSGALAVAAGASIVEKHLTHDRNAKGPDHAASADPRQFREYTFRLREAESLLGNASADRTSQKCEADVRTQSRQSLVAGRTIPAGHEITIDALTCQRPGTGVSASKLDEVVGMIAVRDIPAGSMLDWSDLDIAASPRMKSAA